MPHPTYNPDPIVMPAQIQGVQLTFVGDDEEWVVALGHIDPALFVDAANELVRSSHGLINLFDDHDMSERDWERVFADVVHGWAIRLPACTHAPIEQCPIGLCLSEAELRDSDWTIAWEDATGSPLTADTPGAFPVTYLDLEV